MSFLSKKVERAIWQLDLPSGYRLEYTVVDTDHSVLVLFIGNHDDAAAYLRGKK
jgi:mRNA-degrading endonuclease RelE of RelBE toxin-antitoxin system